MITRFAIFVLIQMTMMSSVNAHMPPSPNNYSMEAEARYEKLALSQTGLKREVFGMALKGFEKGIEEGCFDNSSVLTIVDLSQSANAKRLYIIDLKRNVVLYQTYVAHGRNTGEEYARACSNRPESLMSSMGFYRTLGTFVGSTGLALRLDGLEKDFNDKARQREIVIHGAKYVSEDFIKKYMTLGRSWGCPAIPMDVHKEIINTIKGGSCLFVYFPDEQYLRSSTFLNDVN